MALVTEDLEIRLMVPAAPRISLAYSGFDVVDFERVGVSTLIAASPRDQVVLVLPARKAGSEA